MSNFAQTSLSVGLGWRQVLECDQRQAFGNVEDRGNAVARAFMWESMARREPIHQSDSRCDAADIARWEDEGGTAGSAADRTREGIEQAPSERRVEEPISLKKGPSA
jgi:hypothetical protein